MKIRIDYETLTATQKEALKKIHRLGNQMLLTWDEEYLFDLYCEADDIWNENFPFHAGIEGDDWYLTKRYNDRNREIRAMRDHGEKVTVNIFGNTVTINLGNGGEK